MYPNSLHIIVVGTRAHLAAPCSAQPAVHIRVDVVFHAGTPGLKAFVVVEAADDGLALREGRRSRETAERVSAAQFFDILSQYGGHGSRTEEGRGGRGRGVS